MSQRTSLFTGKMYGLERVCKTWEFPRSTFYSKKARQGTTKHKTTVVRERRGPKTKISDEELLRMIRRDLEFSPFTGEGHRKIHARIQRSLLKVGHTVGKHRVLRLMREHHLLSPHRVKQGRVNPHNGRITTSEPNKMWAADAAKVETVDEGWVWVFWSIEHWNAECIGWHVTKRGDRFAAIEPIAMGVKKVFGSLDAEIARGLQLRIDHGSQYKSEDFKNQIRYWGIAPSMAFVREPETNGVVERFNRTFKEQIIYGRVYRGAEDLRQAVESFIKQYNKSWLLEKLGYKSPSEARLDWKLKEGKKQGNLPEFAEGEENTATTSSVLLKLKDTEPIKIHRVPSVEENTATTSSVAAIIS